MTYLPTNTLQIYIDYFFVDIWKAAKYAGVFDIAVHIFLVSFYFHCFISPFISIFSLLYDIYNI